MSFHDDAHILSRLGILDSAEESPKKAKIPGKRSNESPEKETFVEVNINGDVESESDSDDAIFDQDLLLTQSARPRVMRRRVESFTCRYLLLMLSYFTLGAICHSSAGVSNHSTDISTHKNYVYQCAGILAGALLGRLAFHRISSALLFVVNLLIGAFVSALFYSVPASVNIDAVAVVQGEVVGILSYGGLCLYFSLWRGHNRKLFWFYALFALGTGVILLFSVQDAAQIKPSPVSVVKREAPIPEMDAVMDEGNSTDAGRPKKPQVAQGISSVNTKTQQNEEMRNKAQEKKESTGGNSTEDVSNESGPLSTTSTSTSTTTSTTTTSTTTTPSSTTTTEPTTTVAPVHPPIEVKTTVGDQNRRGKDRYQLSIPALDSLPNASAELFLLILLFVVTTLHVLGFICCCTPCRMGADPKIVKLKDPSMSSFTLGCRIRISAFYVTCGFIESLLTMYLSSGGHREAHLLPWAAFGVRILAILPGTASSSLSIVFVTALIGLASSFGVWLAAVPNISIVLLCAVCGIIPLLVLINIESRLAPRPSVLSDHFIVPHYSGRFLAALSCWLFQVADFPKLIAIAFLILNTIFILLVRSINKAVRLKEIMDYTGGAISGSMGDYLALVEQQQLTLSDEEDGVEL